MKKSLIILNTFCLLVVGFCYSKKNKQKPHEIEQSTIAKTEIVSPATKPNPETKRPKILIFSSKGGNGHMAACATLKDVLPNCDIKLIYPIEDYFKKTGVGEDSYCSLVKDGWFNTMNFVVRYPAPAFFKMNTKSFKKRFMKYLADEKPDLAISVIPFLNYPAAWAAQESKIPFMLITLDADLTNWFLNMGKLKKYDFPITVRAKTPRIEKQLARRHIPASCIKEAGSPLRKEFFQPKDKPAIRKEWNIPDNKKVILLMRGGTGSHKLVEYAQRLMDLDIPSHLLVCIGRNNKLVSKLNKIKPTKNVTLSIVPFTPKIPDLMAISDLLITQPSPNVCNEAMFVKLPIAVDMSGSCLFWEKATVDWLELAGAGQIFKRMKDLRKIVTNILENPTQQYQKSKKSGSCDLVFDEEIKKVVLERLKLKSN